MSYHDEEDVSTHFLLQVFVTFFAIITKIALSVS